MEILGKYSKSMESPTDRLEVATTKRKSKRNDNSYNKEHGNKQNEQNKTSGSPKTETKTKRSKRKCNATDMETYSFKTLIEDVLLILFELLDPRDVAAMAQVENFLWDFVRRKYYPRIILPLSQSHMMDNRKFILRLESICSPHLLKNQLHNANLKKLKEIKMVVPNENGVNPLLEVNIYDALLIEIFLKSPILRKVEIFIHANSKNVLLKLPKRVIDLCFNFGHFPIVNHLNNFDHHHLSSIIQTSLDQANIQMLKLHNINKDEAGARVLKLNSDSLLSLEFQSVAKFVLQELKFPNLTSLCVKDSTFAFSTSSLQGMDFFRYVDLSAYSEIDILRVLYEECPKLSLLFGLDISVISRELGFEEWKKSFAGLIREAADGEVEITRELSKSLKEFNLPRLEHLDYNSEDDLEVMDEDDWEEMVFACGAHVVV